jgi:hypothetical protein
MSLSDAFSILMAFGFVVWILRAVARWCQQTLNKIRGIFPRMTDFSLHDVPLSSEQWQRFCALAHARGISQKRLLADMVVYYFDEKVK